MRIYLIFVLQFISVNLYSQSSIDYIRTNSYDRIYLSLDELKNISSSINYYYKESLKDSSDKYSVARFSCDLVKDGKALTVSSFEQLLRLKIDNESFNKVTLYYRWEDKKISEVELSLNNSFREIKVKGNDEKKVEALFRDIDKQILDAETSFAWVDWTIIFLTINSVVVLVGFSSFIYLVIGLFKGIPRTLPTYILLFEICFLIVIFIWWLLPSKFSDLVSYFSLTPDKSNWWDRNANLLAFIGFLFLIGTCIRKSFIFLRKHIR